MHKSNTINQECISSEANDIVIGKEAGYFAKATTSISIDAGQSMQVSECLCNHEECCGQYTDTVGLRIILSCNCICHYCQKDSGDEQARQPDQPQQQIETSTQER